MDYFTLNKLFTSLQYGYRANRSTELAVLKVMDINIDNMNRNLMPVNVYIVSQTPLTALTITFFSRN